MMKNEIHIQHAIREDYFRWLCDGVEAITESPNTSYRGLMYALFDKEYYWSVPHDDNRGLDGVGLRKEYFDLMNFSGPDYKIERLALNGPCRVLEMMIALAKRCEDDIMYNPKKGDRTRVWFFHMIKNLGLEGYYDANFNFETQEKISKVLDMAIYREYDEKGNGGFFPLKGECQDQRKVELWYQLASWLNENYFEKN